MVFFLFENGLVAAFSEIERLLSFLSTSLEKELFIAHSEV